MVGRTGDGFSVYDFSEKSLQKDIWIIRLSYASSK